MIHNAFLIANKIVNDPKYRPLLSIIKGVRNGIVYGCKIRFPHALVMTFLFRKGTLLQKAKIIFMATKTHAMNLASFVVIYKALRFIFKLFFQEITQLHTLIAAFAGGYFVFGERNNINEQINMYLLSRILFGLTRLAQEKSLLPRSKSSPLFSFSIFGAVVWAIVLWLFEYHIHVLQPSLQASMTYLYHDSNKWNSFRNFLIHNK